MSDRIAYATVDKCCGLYVCGDEGLAAIRAWKDWPVEFTMPCGEKRTYTADSPFPESDVPCPCGDPTHWVIKYE